MQIKLSVLDSNTLNHFTVRKKLLQLGSNTWNHLLCAKNEPWLVKKLLPTNYSFINHIYSICMYNQDLVLKV